MGSMSAATPDSLTTLTRKPERAGDRAVLDDVLDNTHVGTLSTVVDGLPWSVPMLFARDGDQILLHGSTGAGALRHVADGAAVTFSAFIFDGMVIAETLFDHSAHYRSAVVRGRIEPATDVDHALTVLSDKLIPGRVAEVRANTGKERAATLALRLPIIDGHWVAKKNAGTPAEPTDPTSWTGVVPAAVTFGAPITQTGDQPPASVTALSGRPDH